MIPLIKQKVNRRNACRPLIWSREASKGGIMMRSISASFSYMNIQLQIHSTNCKTEESQSQVYNLSPFFVDFCIKKDCKAINGIIHNNPFIAFFVLHYDILQSFNREGYYVEA